MTFALYDLDDRPKKLEPTEELQDEFDNTLAIFAQYLMEVDETLITILEQFDESVEPKTRRQIWRERLNDFLEFSLPCHIPDFDEVIYMTKLEYELTRWGKRAAITLMYSPLYGGITITCRTRSQEQPLLIRLIRNNIIGLGSDEVTTALGTLYVPPLLTD